MSLRREEGVTAVEFALVFPILAILLFGIVQFGIGLMQLQMARGAVREGARAAAVADVNLVRRSVAEVQQITARASNGLISAGQVRVQTCSTPGGQAIVSVDTAGLNGGEGIRVTIPFLPTMQMNSVVTAQFMCEG